MKKFYLLLTLIFLYSCLINAQDWVFAEQFASTGAVTPVDIEVDGNGDIYITGNYKEPLTIGGLPELPYSDLGGLEDVFLCKFDMKGNALWARQIGGDNKELVGGLTIDASNNVYVVGAFKSTELSFQGGSTTLLNDNNYDAFLAKYDGTGSLVFADSVFWGTGVERLLGITYDYTKNYLVAIGQFKTELKYDSSGVKILPVVGPKDHILARFDIDGGFIDKTILNGSLVGSVYKGINNCIIADTVNSYFVAGDLVGKLYNASSTELLAAVDETNMDVMILRFDDKLGYTWGRKGGGSDFDHINSSGSDASGNIYFTGKASSTSIIIDEDGSTSSDPITGPGGQDYLLGKYNRNGNLQWIQRDGGPGTDNAFGLSVRGQRLLYSGNIDNGGNISSGFAVYDLDGNLIISDSITGDGEESGLNVAFDLSGDSTLVIGTFSGDSLKAGPNRLDNTNSGVTDGFFVKYGFKFKVFKVNSTNVLCNGGSTGSIEVATEFGTVPITYAWTPDVSSTNTAGSLAAGTYKIVATDLDLRKDSIEITITEPDDLATSEVLITATSCNVLASGGNKSDGAVDIDVIPGTGPFSYSWSPGGQVTQDLTDVEAGDHIVTVTDANSCIEVDTFTVTEPSKVMHGGTIIDTITIPPGVNGAVHLNTMGGTPGYSYSWTGPPGFIPSVEDTITNLEFSGNYPLQVTDANTCVFDTTFNVPADTGLSIVICENTNVTCKDNEDGYAKVCVTSGGSGSYSYAWRKPSGTPVGLNDDELTIGAGNYIIKVTDLVKDIFAETSVDILGPPAYLTAGVDSIWDESCSDVEDGAVFITVNGGWGSYSYLWTPSNKVTQDALDLAHGDYTVTITDGGYCVMQLTNNTVVEPPPLTVAIQEYTGILCSGNSDGALVAHVSGGTKSYSFSWDDPGAQNDSIASDLSAGTYRVDVTDAEGCTTFGSGMLTEPSALMIDTVMVSNPSYSVLSDGYVDVTASGGTGPYLYALNDGSFQADSVFTGLAVGSDTLWIKDGNGCGPVSKIVILTAPDPDPISLADSSIVNVLCNGDATGAICVTPTGGVGEYYYLWTGTTVTDSCITDLIAGMHEVTISDHISDTLTATLEIIEPAEVLAFASIVVDSADNQGTSNGSIILTASGGLAPYLYFLDGVEQTGSSFTDPSLDSYVVRIDDASGCSTGDSTVTVPDRALGIRNIIGFSNISLYPNPSTGKFTIEMENTEGKDLMLEIMNITGQLVYKKLHKYNGNTKFIEMIDLGDQAKGTYFMRVNGLPVKAKLMVE